MDLPEYREKDGKMGKKITERKIGKRRKRVSGIWFVLLALVVWCIVMAPADDTTTEIPQTTVQPTTVPEATGDSTVDSDVGMPFQPSPESESYFEVHYIDVGQADAALVMCDDKYMLIDGGNHEDSDLIYTYLKNLEISHLDYIVASHAHEDHVGGLSGALNYATVATVYCPVTEHDSEPFRYFQKYVKEVGAVITVPNVGDNFSLGSATAEVLGVNGGSEPNDTSIILKITYGETAFLFMGDAEKEAEDAVLSSGCNLSATVLKVGHHGSSDSTSFSFLREVAPSHAIISVGKENGVGHPTKTVLGRLKDAGVKVYRTDLQGDIIVSSDGEIITVTVEKNPEADVFVPQVSLK